MKNKILSVSLVVAMLGLCSVVLAQGGKRIGKLTVGSTAISQGSIKIGESLTTKEGQKLQPGTYRVSVAMNSLGEVQFVFTPFKVENPALETGFQQNALNRNSNEKVVQIITEAQGVKNLLVKGLASNIEGTFRMEAMTPTESMISFDSSQFGAKAILGRALDTKLIDLRPTFITMENQSDCGAGCAEGNIKVTIRNEGNAMATGKWNVVLLDPQLFVGTVSDVPALGEVSVTSDAKVKLPCCSAENISAEVHADFYNKNGSDSNDSNNTKTFSIRLKQQ